ncbi:D-lactate dehydrogenase [cytochrome], mitochondrial, partial [Tetrabaena socialis]
ESYNTPLPPDLVVFPESTEEVAAVVAACAAERVPVVPYGAVGALYGGVCLDLGRMRAVLAVEAEDMDCREYLPVAKAVAFNELLVLSKLCGLPEDQYRVRQYR